MDKAFTSFINRNNVTENVKAPSRSPELLARYADLLLRKSAKNPPENEVEEALNQVVSCLTLLCIAFIKIVF